MSDSRNNIMTEVGVTPAIPLDLFQTTGTSPPKDASPMIQEDRPAVCLLDRLPGESGPLPPDVSDCAHSTRESEGQASLEGALTLVGLGEPLADPASGSFLPHRPSTRYDAVEGRWCCIGNEILSDPHYLVLRDRLIRKAWRKWRDEYDRIPTDPDDLAQLADMQVVAKRDKWGRHGTEEAFIQTVIWNKLRDERRKGKRNCRPETDALILDDQAGQYGDEQWSNAPGIDYDLDGQMDAASYLKDALDRAGGKEWLSQQFGCRLDSTQRGRLKRFLDRMSKEDVAALEDTLETWASCNAAVVSRRRTK